MKKRIQILTLAGFDPSGGAGILADIKTIESHRCMGMAVQTANTIQTADSFQQVNWIDENFVISQLDTLVKNYQFNAVKIGLIPSVSFLKLALKKIRETNSRTSIIWDPVLSASAGFNFEQDLSELSTVLNEIDWITPNWMEIKKLSKNEVALEGAKELSYITRVYLKGGHAETNIGKDFLIDKGEMNAFNPKNGRYAEKHGSGCVFSTALAANLGLGYPQQKAILRAKRYVEYYLSSHKGLLGSHKG